MSVTPKARPHAVRFTFQCAADPACGGYVTTPDGHTSWKRSDLPKEPIVRPCAACGADNEVERPS